MQQNKLTNSLTVEVTAYLDLTLDGKWHVIGFKPDSLKAHKEEPDNTVKFYKNGVLHTKKKRTQKDIIEDYLQNHTDDDRSPVGRMFDRVQKHRKTASEHLAKAKQNPRHYANRPKKNNWGSTVRKTQECTTCGMRGVNNRTCLAHLNAGDKVHRPPIGPPKRWL